MKLLDPLDARLLLALDAEPDATALALSRTLGIARNTVHARLQRLARSGALREPSRRLDPDALGYTLVAFVSIALSQTTSHLAEQGIAAIPEVVEMHSTTGEADLLVKVLARSTEELRRITAAMLSVEGVTRTNTAISLTEVMPLRLAPLIAAAAGSAGAAGTQPA